MTGVVPLEWTPGHLPPSDLKVCGMREFKCRAAINLIKPQITPADPQLWPGCTLFRDMICRSSAA